MRNGDILMVAAICFALGGLLGTACEVRKNHVEVQALHTQIEKQNCEENTIPRLRKELLQ